jgi:hypothetical protein
MEAFARLERRFEGVIVDCDDNVELAMQLVAGIRGHAESEGTRVIALLPSSVPVKQALSAGAYIAMNKPLRIDHLARSLRVSFHLVPRSERAASNAAAK